MQLTCIVWALLAMSAALSGAPVDGRVTDSSGAPIVGARVRAVHVASGASLEQVTGDTGAYRLPDLAPGAWSLAVTHEGFGPAERRIDAAGGARQDFQLQPAVISESIAVRGSVVGVEEKAWEFPGAVSLIDSATLTQARVFNFDEALRKVPGVFVRGEEGFGLRPNIGIRGLNPTRSSKVLLLEDGLPLTFAPYGANETYYHPPVERFDSIEVVKGSGQILYGPQTVGGVINYISPDPPQRRSGALTLLGGNRDYLNAHARYGGTWRNTGLLFDAMRKQGQGSRDHLRHGLNDVNAKVLQNLTPRQTLSGKFNFWREDSNVTYSGLRLAEWQANPRANPFRNDFFYVDRIGGSGTHSIVISPSVVASTTLYGYHVDRDWWRQSSNSAQRPNDAADPLCGGMANLNTTCGNEGRLRKYTVWGIEPRVKTQQSWFGIRNDLDFGFRAHYELQDRVQQNGPLPTSRTGVTVENNERRNQAYSGFVQNRFVLGKFSVSPGLRLEHVRYQRVNRLLNVRGDVNVTQWIPGVAMTFAPNQSVTFFTGLHRGFAPPRTEDIISNTTGGVVDLDPELSWNYEAGVRARVNTRTSLEAVYFRLDFANQIIPANLSGGVGAALTSAGQTIHEGFEVSGRTEWHAIGSSRHSLSLRGAYTYLPVAEFASRRFSNVGGFSNVLVTGNRLPYAPKSLVNSTLGYTHASGFNALIEGVYTGRQYGDDLNTVNSTADGQRGAVPSWFIWNATVNYPVESWGVTFFVTTKNLGDRLYMVDRVRGMLPGMPRLIQGGLRWTF